MNFIKKQSVGTWLSLATLILTIASAIVYGVHITIKGGTFYGATVTSLVACTVVAVLLLATIIVLAQFEFDGIVGKIVDVTCDVFKIIVPALLILGLMNFISSRVQGLAFIYFSAENILASIQTPANLASAQSAIAGFVMYGITAVVGIVAAFFGLRKKTKAQAQEPQEASAEAA